MGKKGKRSKKKDGNKEADKIINKTNKLLDNAFNNERKELNSKAAIQYREAIRILESKREFLAHTRHLLEAYSSLLIVEYRRRSYKAALDCYTYFIARDRQNNSQFRGFVNLFHQLIVLRQNGQECQIKDFIHFISRKGEVAISIFIEAVFAFRAHKMYDSAIRLEMACGFLMRQPFESKLSLALTYLEQYRNVFNQKSQIRKEAFSTINSLITPMMEKFLQLESFSSPEYMLVLGQWYYLTHTLAVDKSEKEKCIISAFTMVELFLNSIVVIDEGLTKIKQDKCYTCGQAVTPTEVQYVCSGCRVACYCSLDHQRATWKKEAVKGTRIGHEILCPIYKAFRKHLFQKDNEVKESRMKRRLERECVKFLEYGLGLKNKCFPCEYRKFDDEGTNFHSRFHVRVTMDNNLVWTRN
ncbi:predicted protein [Chaetoceros tenuissimus]|uniref:MYND-type domain-containing protein n=1 Tax=Chaetoceros tenuissimus TaxID=426638 RepID=A0AAD3HCY9_9STRA|nr:predicted protein [Chaetoceros tenuissimus]